MAETNPVTGANTVAASTSAPIVPSNVLSGTEIPLPTGSGVEKLRAIRPPFRSNGPAWYTPPDSAGNQSIWSILGCAVSQPGRYLQTQNADIWDFVTVGTRQLFSIMWSRKDRQFTRFPSRDFLWEVHQLIKIARSRLAAMTVADSASPMTPTHAVPFYEMFLVNPIPLYGVLGCPNTWVRRMACMMLMMFSEAMQHSDNGRSFYVTPDFAKVVYGYLKWTMVSMATKFFGIDVAVASADDFVIPAAAWATYDPTQSSVSIEGSSTRYPPGYDPTDLDLEPIRDLPIEQVIPYLQNWPDSQLKYASGGIWANPPDATSVPLTTAAPVPSGGIASVLPKSGPPNS